MKKSNAASGTCNSTYLFVNKIILKKVDVKKGGLLDDMRQYLYMLECHYVFK